MKNKLPLIITILIVVTWSLVVKFFVYPQIQYQSKIFTKEKWDKDIYKREVMLPDLVDKNPFENKTKSDIISLLGKNGLTKDAENELSYTVGKDYIDPHFLHIIFNENGYYSKHFIATN